MTCSFDILTVNETAMLDVYIRFLLNVYYYILV